MLIVMTVLAGLLGYAANWAHQRRAVLALPGVIGVSGDEDGVENVAIPAGGGPPQTFAVDPQPAPWPLSWLGERGYIAVVFAEGTTDADLVRARVLFPEAEIERK